MFFRTMMAVSQHVTPTYL